MRPMRASLRAALRDDSRFAPTHSAHGDAVAVGVVRRRGADTLAVFAAALAMSVVGVTSNAYADRGALIVSDSLFSHDGDVAPLEDLVELAQLHRVRLLVDEEDAMGSLGPLLRALEDMPDVLGRRIDAEDRDVETWKALARAGRPPETQTSFEGAAVVVRTLGAAGIAAGDRELSVSPSKAIQLAAAVAWAGAFIVYKVRRVEERWGADLAA